MREHVQLHVALGEKKQGTDERLISYNIEFAEVTGGTFWKEYTQAQIDGKEDFSVDPKNPGGGLMQNYPPVDLSNRRLRYLARELGPAWVRVSGTWATKTYYDFDGQFASGEVPEGYQNVLTKEQWTGVLDFVKDVGAKLMISVANCEGLHHADEPWKPDEAEKIFSFSQDYGVPISAAEFTNEPNLREGTGTPKGYSFSDYARDQDLFFSWLRKHYPNCLCVGPSNIGPDNMKFRKKAGFGGNDNQEAGFCEQMLQGTKESLDIFSYHYYNGASQRLAAKMPGAHWPQKEATGEAYLRVAGETAKEYAALRDIYCPGGDLWVTESGDASGGGNTWASTYLDVIRTLNELGSFACISRGVIFHNTLTSSDYGFLERGTHKPRPNYFAVLLWNRIMGNRVYETQEPIRLGAHVYAHSRKDGKQGIAYLIINNSETEITEIDLPKEGELYLLSGRAGNLCSGEMLLNGRKLALDENGRLPQIKGQHINSGRWLLPPETCGFIVL